MVLGRKDVVPPSKLLRKVEQDSLPLWARRYLQSVLHSCPEMPEHIWGKVEAYLGNEA